MHPTSRLVLVIAAVLLVVLGTGTAYIAWMARIEPQQESPLRIRDLRRHLGRDVTVRGIAGRRIEGTQPGLKVFALYDDYGDTTLVRTTADWPVTGITYVVRGTVERSPARRDPILVEKERRIWRLEPYVGRGMLANAILWVNSMEGGSTMGVLVGLLLVGIGFIIAGFLYLRSVSPAPVPIGGGNKSSETVWVPPPAPPRPRETLEAWGRFQVTAGPDQGKSFPIVGNKVNIGREGTDIALNDDTISRQHAYIVRTNDGRIVYVDQSRNGSIVNGKSLHMNQVEVSQGAKIELGMTLMEFNQFYTGAAPAGEVRPSRRPTVQAEVPRSAASRRPTEAMGVELTIIGGPDSGKRFPLHMDSTTIGRLDDRDVQLSDESVSRRHATINYEGGEFVIRDDGSSHGIYVNSELVASRVLKSGDTIAMGRTTMRFERRG